MKTKARLARLASLLLIAQVAVALGTIGAPATNTVRVAAAQAARRVIDFRLKPDEALAAVERNLAELERIIDRAGEAKCDVLVLPEDTPGLLNWTGANETLAKELLPKAVTRMLERLGSAAARHRMYLVVCSDLTESDGSTYNTAFLLGRDGQEIGRYHKVCPTWSEGGARQRGTSFPVFPTRDLGTAGLLICYDLVVPETARCLALQGADIIFFPTMGGAAIGDGDIGVQALRVRAAENFIWLVVAQRGSGAMIISPQGKIVAQAEGPDGLAIADIDPRGHREGGDALNWQRDMRARLFRERNPEAFRILTDTNPPVLAKVPISLTQEEAGRIMSRALTVGEDQFKQVNDLIQLGRTEEAISAFERLRRDYPATWIDRQAQERLAELRGVNPEVLSKRGLGITAKHAVASQVPKTPPRTGLIYDDIYLKHDTGAGHPERAERLVTIRQRLERTGLLSQLALIKPQAASVESLAKVRDPQYIDHVRQICRAGTGYVDSPDTPASPDSYEVALMAAGGVQSAVDAVMEGRIRNAFCAVRPPGHHALKDRAMGFCFFNNVAIAAKYIQNKHRLAKVLIVDWDVHHGNGTQAIFYDDPTVFYFSTHQSPFYPGTGGADEKGEGKGLGFTLNVPLPAGSGDAEYTKAFEERLKPAAAAFQPDFVLISAGFDAARGDLLGRMDLTPEGYAQLTRIVKAIAQQYCRGRLVSVLEGGYNLEALAASVEAHVRVLME
jgi:acetoin utilization deacetylase AcuC-like enzyme/predicted amidohydrolase